MKKIMFTQNWQINNRLLVRIYEIVMHEEPDILVIDNNIFSQNPENQSDHLNLLEEAQGILLTINPNLQIVSKYNEYILDESMIESDSVTMVNLIDGKKPFIRHIPIKL